MGRRFRWRVAVATSAAFAVIAAIAACTGSDPDLGAITPPGSDANAGSDGTASVDGPATGDSAVGTAATGCVVGQEDFDLCDDFDDAGIGDPFLPRWTAENAGALGTVERTAAEHVSPPHALVVRTQPLAPSSMDRFAVAGLSKTFIGKASSVVIEYSLRLGPTTTPDAGADAALPEQFPFAFGSARWVAPDGNYVQVARIFSVASADGGAITTALSQVDRGVQTLGFSPAWTKLPTIGKWSRVRHDITRTANEVTEVVHLDGELVLDWKQALPAGVAVDRLEIGVGTFAGAPAGTAQLGYEVFADDVHLRVRD